MMNYAVTEKSNGKTRMYSDYTPGSQFYVLDQHVNGMELARYGSPRYQDACDSRKADSKRPSDYERQNNSTQNITARSLSELEKTSKDGQEFQRRRHAKRSVTDAASFSEAPVFKERTNQLCGDYTVTEPTENTPHPYSEQSVGKISKESIRNPRSTDSTVVYTEQQKQNEELLEKILSTDRKSTLSVDDIDDYFFICEICCQDFDENEHVPLVLPCLHTICQMCLENRTRNSSLICPVCRCRHTIRGESPHCFPKENTRRTLRDLVDLSRLDRRVTCRDCPDKGHACCFCRQCYAFLCNECKKAHLRNFITRDHKVVGLEKIKDCGIEQFQRKQTCSVKGHEGQQLAYFCERKSCFKPACKMCVVLEHDKKNGHPVKKLTDVYRHHITCVSDLVDNLNDKIINITKVAEEADDEIQQLEKKEVFISDDIDKEIDKGIQMLEARREELKETLRIKCREKKGVLRKQKDLLKYNLRLMKTANEFSMHETNYAMPAEFVVLTETICGRLVTLLDRPFDTMPLENSYVHFDRTDFSTGIREFVSRIGHVRTTSVHPYETKVETFNIAVDSSAEVLRVTLNDLQGIPQKNEIECINVSIKSPKGDVAEGLIESDQSPGSYRVFYAARIIGDHVAYVYVLGRLVRDDGFVFKVKAPGEIDKHLGEIICPGFIYDDSTVHPERKIVDNGRKLKSDASQLQASQSKISKRHQTSAKGQNVTHLGTEITQEFNNKNYSMDPILTVSISDQCQRSQAPRRQLQKYCGAVGSKPFHVGGKYYYEVTVSYSIYVTLVRNALVFEIGIGSLDSIRNSFYVGSQAYAWSFSVERCNEHRQLCNKFRHNRTLMLHAPISSDAAGTSVTNTYGFVLDTIHKRWSVIDCDKQILLYSFTCVESSDELWPVFGTYNPFSVYVEMQLKTGNAIEIIPEIASV